MEYRVDIKYKVLSLALAALFFWGCDAGLIDGGGDIDDNTSEPPPQVTLPTLVTLEVEDIGEKSATSGGNIHSDGGSAVTHRGVCWGTSANPTTANKIVESGEGKGLFSASLTELEPGTTYHVRAYATNSKGTAYGNNISFKTIEEDSTDPNPTDPPQTPDPLVDSRDGNIYQTVQIGPKIWMAENLRFLPSLSSPSISSNSDPHYLIYDSEETDVELGKLEENYNKYGALYNWSAAKQSCPAGWHLPTDNEWLSLISALGGELVAGGKMKESGTQHWQSAATGSGNNESGFTALPAGAYDPSSLTKFSYLYRSGFWWSATEDGPESANYKYIDYNSHKINSHHIQKKNGYSVRCVKD